MKRDPVQWVPFQWSVARAAHSLRVFWSSPEQRLRRLELRRLCRIRVEEFEESRIREEIHLSRVSLRRVDPLKEWER